MNQQGEIVLYQPDGEIKLEVRLENETVWLSIDEMSHLFGRDISVIASHPACAGQTLRAIIGAESKVDTASPAVRFALKPGKVLLFDRETEERIRF